MENPRKRAPQIAPNSQATPGGQCYTAHASGNVLTDNLKVWYSNADSLRVKLPELTTRLQAEETPVDIIVITESWPKNNRYTSIEAEYQLNGFDLHCTDVNAGRGICIYTNCTLKTDTVELSTDFKEYLCLSIPLHQGDRLILCAIYRSPNSDNTNNDKLYSLLEEIQGIKASHKLVIGDFNFPNINWERNCATDRKAEKFMEVIQSLYWTQHVKEPTRVRGADIPSILDLVFTEDENNIELIKYDSPIGKSDHCLITMSYQCYMNKEHEEHHKYFFDKGNYKKMEQGIQQDWHQRALEQENLNATSTMDDKWTVFKNIYYENLKKHVPNRRVSKGKQKWLVPLDAKLREKIKEKHKAWRTYMRDKTKENHTVYTRCRNYVRSETRKVKSNYEKSIAMEAKHNPKKFWRYVKSKTKVNQQLPELFTEEGTAKSDQDKADALNSFFASVFVQEPPGIVPSLDVRTTATLQDVSFTVEKIMKKLKNLKIAKSPGPDKIHPRALKECAEAVSIPLHEIFKSSFDQSIVPTDWKQAEVCAIFKKGSRKSCTNYRPVSLTSIACKVMESIVRDELMSYMLNNNLLSPRQYGFVAGRSTVLQLLYTLDKWTEALDRGEPIEAVYMDFQKAFDTVPHRRLISKLQSYGISGKLLNWLRDFLTNRQQRVRVNGHLSSVTSIESGIPQGSVLGPMLFVFYINDLPDNIMSEVMLFADDTKLYRTGHISRTEEEDELQRDLDRLQKWSDKWLLKFHPDKCKRMLITRTQADNRVLPLTLSLDTTPGGTNKEIETVLHEKDLGVIIDNNLKFNSHIDASINKANKIMGLIRRTFDFLDVKTFRALYTALVRPIVEYGQAVWSPYHIGDIRRLESVQRNATRRVNGLKGKSYSERLHLINLPTLRFRRLRGDMIETYKIIHQLYDPLVSPQLSLSARTSRGHQFKLFQERSHRLEIRRNFFTFRIVRDWNSLPDSVVSSESLNTFKARLDAHWKDHPLKFNADWDPEVFG